MSTVRTTVAVEAHAVLQLSLMDRQQPVQIATASSSLALEQQVLLQAGYTTSKS